MLAPDILQIPTFFFLSFFFPLHFPPGGGSGPYLAKIVYQGHCGASGAVKSTAPVSLSLRFLMLGARAGMF